MWTFRHRIFTTIMLVFICACATPAERLHDELYSLRDQRNQQIDAMYVAYGGGAASRLANELPDEAPMDEIRGAAAELDRLHFEQLVAAIGSGERPGLWATQRTRSWFSEPAIREGCRQVVATELRIQTIERQLQELGIAP